MEPLKRITIIVLFAWIVLIDAAALSAGTAEFKTTPNTNNGNKWRIGYYEGGSYHNYYKYLKGTVQGLMDLGWIEETQIPDQKELASEPLWNWLATEAKSKYIKFVKDAYYSAHWDKGLRENTAKAIIDRFKNKKDIDLMIAMGTWAGKDLANAAHDTYTVVMSTSDPVGSGIIKSVEDSGYDHVHVRVDPFRYERQVRIFHNIIKFKKLGVAYEDTVIGRSYAAINLIEKVAKERSFEIVSCYTQSDIEDQDLAGKSVINCYKELAPKVDAIYVTVQGGVNSESMPRLVEIANKNRIPTFSQYGSKEVKYGILLSISRAGGFRPAGRFFALTFAQIFNGAQPRQLEQVFEEAQNIAINLETAEIIGLYLYADILAAADEIYRKIETPE